MDGKTGFAIILVLTGILAAFLAVTGRAKAIIAAIAGTAPDTSAPSTSTSASTSTGSSAPSGLQSDPGQAGISGAAGGSWSAPTTSANVGAIATMPSEILAAIEYNSLIGTDGVKALPYATPA